MTDRLIRIKTVMDMTGKSRSAIYADIANGCFPSPISIGARSVAWAESAISGWIKSKIDAAKLKVKPETKAADEKLRLEILACRKAGKLHISEISQI